MAEDGDGDSDSDSDSADSCRCQISSATVVLDENLTVSVDEHGFQTNGYCVVQWEVRISE